MSKLAIVRDMVIYRDDRYYCGPGPSAVQLADGTLCVAFRRAHSWLSEGIWRHAWPSTEACLVSSTDGGRTWSQPRVFAGGDFGSQNLTLLPDGTIISLMPLRELLPTRVYEQIKDVQPLTPDPYFGWVSGSHGIQVLRTADNGVNWDGPHFVSPIPDANPVLPGWPSKANFRASPIPLADGGIGVAVYGVIGQTREATNVWFMVSDDGGQTWTARGRIAHDAAGEFYFNETGVYQCSSGKLVAFIRVEKDPEKSLYTSTSTDGGRTWSPPRREGVKGYPYQAARLPSGRVLLAYGYRYEPMGVRARVLDPECDDIAGAEEIVLRDDGGMSDLGYPHVLPLADGTTMVTYYHNLAGDTRYVAATIVAEDA